MPSGHERVIAAELVTVMGVETLDALVASGGKSTFSLPDPSVYFATLVVYLMLSGLALFGDRYGKLAAAFGGVAAAGILMTPTARSKQEGKPKPLVMSMITYFDSIISGGTEQAPITPPAKISEKLGKPTEVQKNIKKLLNQKPTPLSPDRLKGIRAHPA
jgi:hypothetical protein